MNRRLLIIVAIVLVLAILAFAFVRHYSDSAGPDTVVYVTETGKRYHKGNCRSLRYTKIETTLADAQAEGYTPCRVCKPPK